MPASLSFAKIVATPTETAWSQVYHAGNLFALVSLSGEKPETDLNSLGKEMFNTLESSFFSLEKKNLESISEVITESLKELPKDILISASIAFSKDAILYLFLVGTGTILMKRGEKIGVILSKKEDDGRHVLSSSGFLNHEDILLLQTGSFTKLFPYDSIKEALELHHPNDISEHLTKQQPDLPGDASAVTLMYQGATSPDAPTMAQEMRRVEKDAPPEAKSHQEEEDEQEEQKEMTKQHEEEVKEPEANEEADTEESEEQKNEDAEENEPKPMHTENLHEAPTRGLSEEEKEMRAWENEHPGVKPAQDDEGHSPVTVKKRTFAFPSRRVLFGLIALILVVVLVLSIFVTKQGKESNETKAVYEQTMSEATKQFEEAEGLKNLNASLAQDDYKKAATLIKAALPKVKTGSEEEKNLKALLAKIEQNIEKTEGATVQTKDVDLSESPLLSLASEKNATAVATDADKEYALTSTVVTEGDEELIKNDDDWKSTAGLGAYNGNIYILDKSEGILKFTAGSDGFGKSSYFSGDAPSLTKASGMGIDGSIYVLFSDGNIKKYTKGKEESFVLSGLPSPFKSPKQLVTGTDMDSIYVLDSGNSRVVKISKDGKFEKAWKADVLATASFIDVQEDDKKIYILKGKNLSMMSME